MPSMDTIVLVGLVWVAVVSAWTTAPVPARVGEHIGEGCTLHGRHWQNVVPLHGPLPGGGYRRQPILGHHQLVFEGQLRVPAPMFDNVCAMLGGNLT